MLPRMPTITPQRKEIGGYVYVCEPHGFDESVDLWLDVQTILGGGGAEALQALTFGDFNLGGDIDAAMEAVAVNLPKLFGSLETLAQLIAAKGGSRFLARCLAHTWQIDPSSGTEVERDLSSPGQRDAAFAGQFLRAWEVAAWVLWVNYSPFSEESSESLLGWLKGLKGRFEASSATRNSEDSPPKAAPSSSAPNSGSAPRTKRPRKR